MLNIVTVVTALATLTLSALAQIGQPVPPSTFSPVGHPNLCMDVRGGVFQEGTPVQLWECNGTPAQAWTFEHGLRAFRDIRLNGTDLCMNYVGAGYNGRKMALLKCFTGARNWMRYEYTTEGDKFTGMIVKFTARKPPLWALDVTDGGMYSGNQLQVWEPSEGNPNQQWVSNPI